MRHHLRLLLPFVLLALCASLFFIIQNPPEAKVEKLPKMQRIDKAMELEFEKTKDPALGVVPRERLGPAMAYADRLRKQPTSTRAGIVGINWTERGPSNVSGRTRAVLVDAGDVSGNTVYAGGVGGGLWRTTNALAGSPTWTAINNIAENLAISCIYQDPSDSDNIYYGTGEGWYNVDAIRGLGIFASTDGGATWAQLPSTNNSNFHYVNKIVVDGSGNVFACTRSGLRRSTNNGSTWTEVLGAGNGSSNDNAMDIEIAANGDMYVSMGRYYQTDGIYKSTNGGTTWTKLTGGGLPSSGYGRIELACAPSNQNRVYALYQSTSTYDCYGIYRTDNGGTSWTTLSNPAAFGMSNFCRGQAWYDLICAVDPNNDARVFIGGIDILVSTNSGSSWTQIAQWYGGGGYQYAHADQHAMVFQSGSSSVMYYGNDGGVYRSTNANATTPTINFISNGYNVTQYYGADLANVYGSNNYLAGAQDNGTQYYTAPGMNATTEVTGGDGAYSHIDQDQPNIQISQYVYNQYRVTNNSWGSYTNVNISSSVGLFINPSDYDSDNNILYGSYNNNAYSYISGVGSSNSTGSRSVSLGGGEATALKVSPNVNNRLYIGTNLGDVYRIDNAHTASSTVTQIRNASNYVSCVEIQPGDEDHIIVTYSNFGVTSVYETTNGGTSWTSVEGNLPDMPVRWALFAPGESDQMLLGTEVGVWSTDDLDGTSTTWDPSNGGLANVRTDMLQYRTSDQQVIACTHGRGLYSTDHFNIPLTCPTTVSSFPYGESFESGLGDWTYGGGDFEWIRNSGTTPSSGTGPSGAHDGSFYMYVEASNPNYPSKTTYFVGPCFDLTGQSAASLSFRYHMLGAPGTLQLQASTDFGSTWPSTVWSISGDQGSTWNLANVSLNSFAGGSVRLRFVGTTGTTWQGDICIDSLNMTVSSGAPPLVASISGSTDVSCNGGNDGSATASATGGTPPYTYLWSDGQTTATATGLAAGNYSVTVTDNASATDVANVTITEPSAVSVSSSVTDVSCFGGNDGSATANPSGGTPGYTYLWSDGQTTQTATGLSQGNYSVTVTDANGCTEVDNITVDEPNALSTTASATDASCNAGSDGTATASPVGGNTPYTYLWSDGQTTATATGLAAGNYSVTVTDANGCTGNANATVGEPSAISVGTSTTDASCNGGTDGTATASPSGGTPGYTYLWSDGQTTATATGLGAGNYSVTVTDANGCTANANVTVSEATSLVVTASGTDVSCNGGNDGTATAGVSGGTTPYTYLWSDGQTTATATNLTAGNYSVTVTDNVGCSALDNVTINEPSALSASASATDVSCNAGNDGTATAFGSGGTPSYSYLWSDGQTTGTATGLIAGNYSVTITDANGCTDVANTTVSEPSALSASASATDASCNAGNDGTATASPTGGTPGYTYLWSDGQTTATATGLAAGNYSVTVTDANGCTTNANTTVGEPSVVTATASTTANASCNAGNDGSATVAAGGGTPGYTYLWSDGQTTATATGLAAGAYTVTVTDASGCTANDGVTITEPSALNLSISGTDESAPGANDGAADLTVSGGTPGYTFLWNTSATTEDISGLAGGTYDVDVTDANGCTANEAVVINTITPSSLRLNTGVLTSVGETWQTVNLGDSYTSMVVVATVVMPNSTVDPVVTRVRNASGSSFQLKIQSTTGSATSSTYDVHYFAVEEGVYTVLDDGVKMEAVKFNSTVTAENNNWAFEAQTYANSYTSPVVLGQVMTENDADWSVFWASENGSRTDPPSASSFAAGKNVGEDPDNTRANEIVGYVVFESGNGTIEGLGYAAGVGADIVLGVDNTTTGYNYPISGLSTASVAVLSVAAMDGGNGGWATLYGASPVSTSQIVVVFDEDQENDSERAHTSEQVAYIVFEDQPDPCAGFTASASATDASCNGSSDGTATASPSGGTAPYTYLWSDGQTTATATGLAAGSYTVTVTDDEGCDANAGATVNEPSAVTSAATATDVSCNGDTDGTASANASGGTGPYTYLWSDGQTTATATGLAPGNYTVTVTDANGCTGNGNATVGEPSVLSSTASGVDVSCNGGSDGSASANPSGGTSPYSYLWSDGQTTQTAINLANGNYTVTVTDANGCTANANASVTEPSALSLSIAGTDESGAGNNDGAADLTVSGGTPGYTYSWSNGATTEDISGLAGGTYDVDVTDANGCTANESVVINTVGGPAFLTENGVVSSVSESWQTVTLANTYTSMVVVATVHLPNNTTDPVVSRVRNASGNSFDLRIQSMTGSATVSTYDVHYFVVEEGVYTDAADGVKMEAVKVNTSLTSRKSNWVFEARTYSNSYTNPVVVGQVMTVNDADWSAFWASSTTSKNTPPTASSFAAGKHVGEDPDNTRLDETIGYVVFEAGSGTMGSVDFEAGLGSDIVRGATNSSSGYNYSLSSLATATAAVLSSSAMDGNDGGVATLFGASPLSTSQITMVVDEDQESDSERNHTTEQVAYVVFGTATTGAQLGGDVAIDINHTEENLGTSILAPEVKGPAFTYYPNPVRNGELFVSFEQATAGQYTLRVFDMKGKLVLSQQGTLEAGPQKKMLQVDHLANGYYHLQLIAPGVKQTGKFVKMNW